MSGHSGAPTTQGAHRHPCCHSNDILWSLTPRGDRPPDCKGVRPPPSLHKGRLEVWVKAAKNLQHYNQRQDTTIYKADDPAMCLLVVVKQHLDVCPTSHSTQVMFVFASSQRPITTSYLRTQWNVALKVIGARPDLFTLHTLRKATALWKVGK